MCKCTKTSLLLCGAALAVCGGAVWLTAPGRSRRAQRAPFEGQNFAHRGLYNTGAGIPENSLAAFRAAAEQGFGVELDTRLTADGYVVVSHDDALRRMTGADQRVSELTLHELQTLHLNGTEETVPLFSDVLDVLCAAAVPVIVEVKTCERYRELCRKTLSILDEHSGSFCVESFDPRIVRWFRINAPEMLRGQLTSQRDDLGEGAVKSYLVSRVLTNFFTRPQFIAHHVGKKSWGVKLCEALGAMRVIWTAHDRSEEVRCDAVIFEHFVPPVHFR